MPLEPRVSKTSGHLQPSEIRQYDLTTQQRRLRGDQSRHPRLSNSLHRREIAAQSRVFSPHLSVDKNRTAPPKESNSTASDRGQQDASAPIVPEPHVASGAAPHRRQTSISGLRRDAYHRTRDTPSYPSRSLIQPHDLKHAVELQYSHNRPNISYTTPSSGHPSVSNSTTMDAECVKTNL